ADSYHQTQQLRLHVLYAAWLIDQHRSYPRIVRTAIAATKVATAKVIHDIVYRAIHLHGSLGATNEMPLMQMWQDVINMAAVDGPTEVHQVAVAKGVLRDVKPAQGLFPTAHLPPRIEAAKQKYAQYVAEALEHEIANS
ncbi:MAG: acyl-CoA dehydrogenase family protein, partial [Gammaproteobacteria bacterium]